MKILGYVLKGMSLYIFVSIARVIYSMVTGNVPIEIKNKGEETQYILGQILIVLTAGFIAYKLYQFGEKMIKKNTIKTNKTIQK
jgi:hypothetical protein